MSGDASRPPEREGVLVAAARLLGLLPGTVLVGGPLPRSTKTTRVQRPVQILGSLDGIQTGIRQLIRKEPLEPLNLRIGTQALRVPTPAEMMRMKAVLILKRNATRDYLDFVAMALHLGDKEAIKGMWNFDDLYPQPNGASAVSE